MNRSTCLGTWLCAIVMGVVCMTAFGQGGAPPPAAKEAPKAVPKLVPKDPHRRLAPGVLHTVEPDPQLGESFSRHDVVELLAVSDKYTWAKDVAFRHDVWALEFKFKPVRMIYVHIPQSSGELQRKLIWYMVYSVTNPGKTMHPVPQPDGTYKIEYEDRAVRFIPRFTLVGYESMKEEVAFEYKDQVMPVAAEQIRLREDRTRKFYTTGEMCREIAVGETVWGVATWEDVNLRVKRFSIYVDGLTNAYRWTDPPGAFKDPREDWPGKNRRFMMKSLKLNFWRPADDKFPHEEEIRYGVPGEVDYKWVWR